MTHRMLFAYLATDFGGTLPPDPMAAALTRHHLPVSLSRSAAPVQIVLALAGGDGQVETPARLGALEVRAGDRAVALWTLVDPVRAVRLTAYRIDCEDGPVTAITTALPLAPGQAFRLSLPADTGADGLPFLGGLARGTRVLTERGKRPVEQIAVGDLVWTAAARFEPVIWVGSQTRPARGLAAPVRLRRGVWGLTDDLRISGNHAVRAEARGEAALVPAGVLAALGLGQFEFGASVTWHQILLPAHAVILAQGLGCETLWPPVGLSLATLTGFPEGHAPPDAPVLPRLTEAEARTWLS